jgi:endo-1,4-beta-xylanase
MPLSRGAAGTLSRRQFLTHSAAATAGAAGFSACVFATPATTQSRKQLRVTLVEADGAPLDPARLRTFHARDLSNDPLPVPISFEKNVAIVTLPNEPVQLSCRLKVPNFGEVYCYADNDGGGYWQADAFVFHHHAAETRSSRASRAWAQAIEQGVPLERKIHAEINAAGAMIRGVALTYDGLARTLRAGEMVALSVARHRISKLPAPRKDFLFGCAISPMDSRGPAFAERVAELCNFGTGAWYTWSPNEDPPDQRINYARMDQSIEWCARHNLTCKGFGYCYMTAGATPAWLRKWPFERIVPEYARVVRDTMKRCDGRLPYAEIINEAHDKANLWRLNHEQILRLTKAVCDAAREGSATVKRQINNCCLWAEYAKNPGIGGVRRWSPYRYIRDCIDFGVNFEVLGLQLYYPEQDLLEIDRMLDRFAIFNKPCHISEIACASVDGLDKDSMRPTTAAPGWHGPWSESTQADWAEAIYTLVYSKPHFGAIGWWDLGDWQGHFWPYGGLLHADARPKESYLRLVKLLKSWGVR